MDHILRIYKRLVPIYNRLLYNHYIFGLICETRASKRLKYRSGLGSGSAKFIFSGLLSDQVYGRLILQV